VTGAFGLLDREEGQSDGEHRDRHVEQEHRLPLPAADDHPGDDRAEPDGQCVRPAPDTQRQAELLGGEGVAHQGERGGLQQRSGESLQHPEQHQRPHAAGQRDAQ
jgi:hypothetical protein